MCTRDTRWQLVGMILGMTDPHDVAAAIADLGLGDRFTFDELVGAVQTTRERPLRIVELSELGQTDGVCALWLVTESEDIVLHARSESQLHRQQFILHELAHMVLHHDQLEEATAATSLLPDIPPETVTKMLARHEIDSDIEVAAEHLADILAAGIRQSSMRKSRFLEVFG